MTAATRPAPDGDSPDTAPPSATAPLPALADVLWDRFHRCGPYAVLALATFVAVLSGRSLMSRADVYAAAVMVPLVLGLEIRHSRARRAAAGSGLVAPLTLRAGAPVLPLLHGHDPAGQLHFVLRALLTIGLTVTNPSFALYSVVGFFAAPHLLPGARRLRAGLVLNAIAGAGAQSGGLPPATASNWTAFGALFLLNSALCFVFARITEHEQKAAREKIATIAELERTNARLTRALAENAHLQAQLLVQAREAGVAGERQRLAAEIHDTIAQALAGVVTQLQAAAGAAEPETARTHMSRAAELARAGLGEARRSVHDLAPPALEHDCLSLALEKTVADWSERTGIPAGFTVTGTEEPLHGEVAAALLRIVQEALANTARHAGAGRAGVTLTFLGGEVVADVRDDGTGFDPLAVPAPRGGGGFGLRAMRARAERVAGRVEVESEPGRGTAVSARVPLVPHG
ncbi:sensor histidine kinase [Streptomyces sp. NPDC020875]|uniref:sensor histidine kinase n=1 Tax=Streptomyces sp. NPDC020875 TaxID=3154898 RepID=UPI0033C4125B